MCESERNRVVDTLNKMNLTRKDFEFSPKAKRQMERRDRLEREGRKANIEIA